MKLPLTKRQFNIRECEFGEDESFAALIMQEAEKSEVTRFVLFCVKNKWSVGLLEQPLYRQR